MTRNLFGLGLAVLLTAAAPAETVQFKEPRLRTYEIIPPVPDATVARAAVKPEWLVARPVNGGRRVEFGRRVVARFTSPEAARQAGVRLQLPVTALFQGETLVFTTGSARAALQLAAQLSRDPAVEFAVPAARRGARRHYAYAAAPNDPYYPQQPHLDATPPAFGPLPIAAMLNTRSAWADARGAGVIVGIGDDGMDLTHPDLTANATGPHHNFFTGANTGSHPRTTFYHGTAVAGLIGARGDNGVGISGVAPRAALAAWIIFDANDNLPDDAGLASVFAYANDTVAVQNHSWGNADFLPLEMPAVQALAISNAVTLGRGGRGVVVVRSAGNTRIEDYDFNDGVGDANLDGYANDIHQLTVAALRPDGRVASYSTPGACVLVAAPGGDTDAGFDGLFTTDPVGSKGANRFVDPAEPQLADYLRGANGFVGTSAAAPLISGVTALVLSANPALTWRDVHQLLALSARHHDLADPDLTTNGAGLRVSHNVGFGVPDTGTAVRLAKTWKSRPAWIERPYLDTNVTVIPDEGFRVELTGENIPEALRSLPATGGTGRYPDTATGDFPLRDVGTATTAPGGSLHGLGALIQRGGNTFADKLTVVADAGATLAIISDITGTNERYLMLGTDLTAIPGAFLGRTDGQALRELVRTNATVKARLRLNSAERTFTVTDALLVERVQLHLKWQHPRQGDLRVTLRSPAGTVSILQRPGTVNDAVVPHCSFSSTLHLGESSLGTWTVAVTDIGLAPGTPGTLEEAELHLHGVPLTDTDADGLDDPWERTHFTSLGAGPQDDPDGDGWNNATEQLRGSDPTTAEDAFALTLTPLGNTLRVSWPATDGGTYRLQSTTDLGKPFSTVQELPGRFPEAGFYLPASPRSFFRVERNP